MKRRRRTATDIDITSLIDVLFMLIIFFVLTASFVQGKLDVELPSGEGASADPQGAIIVTVTKESKIFWDGKAVTITELKNFAHSCKREVLVAGDEQVSYGKVTEVLSILRKEGITRAGLMLSGEKE